MILSINITTTYPLWLSFFCVLLGVIYAYFLYRKDAKLEDVAKVWIKLMAVFRAIVVSLLAFFLLSPMIKTIFNRTEKPVIIIAQDNSSSILLNKDSTFYKTNYLNQLNQLKSKLSENYKVKFFNFGDKITEVGITNYKEKITDLSNLFDEIHNRFDNNNVGALILASDGIFNQGLNPVYENNQTEFPVYTIALGDTTIQKDIILKEVNFNKITFLNNQFPIEIYGIVNQAKGEKTKLTITNNGKKLIEKIYNFNSNNYTIKDNFLIKADKIGVQHYKIELSTIKGETSFLNNQKDIYVDVLDGRQKILILANAPHPDVKALKLSIEQNKNYKVEVKFSNDFDGNFKSYNLVIFHNIPKNYTAFVNALKLTKIASLFVLGNQTSINQLNTLDLGLNIKNNRNNFNEVHPFFNPQFPLFTLSESTLNTLNQFPPMSSPFGNYNITKENYVLFNQQIGSVKTDNPLIFFLQNDNIKIGFICGEGFWRWRMIDFAKNQNQNAFDELINKTIQYLSVKEDKNKFRIKVNKNFNENEEIVFNAELYNNSYELINKPKVTLSVKDENGKTYQFEFNKTNNAYILN